MASRTISKLLLCEDWSEQYLNKCKEEQFYHEDTLKLYHQTQTTRGKLTTDLFIEMADNLELETETDFPKLQKAMLKINLMRLVYYVSNRKHLYDCCERYTMDVLDKDNFSRVEMDFYIELRKHSLRSELQELRVLRGDDGAIKAEEVETILRKHFPSKFEYALINPENPSEQEERAIEKSKQAYADLKSKNIDEIIESFSKEAMNDELLKLIGHMEKNVFNDNTNLEANSRIQNSRENTPEDVDQVDEDALYEIDELEESDEGIDDYETDANYFEANEELPTLNHDDTAIVVDSDDNSDFLYVPEEEGSNSPEAEVELEELEVEELEVEELEVEELEVFEVEEPEVEELEVEETEVDEHAMEEENTQIESPPRTSSDDMHIERSELELSNDNVPSTSANTERPNKRHKPESSNTSSVNQVSNPPRRRLLPVQRTLPQRTLPQPDVYHPPMLASELEYAEGQNVYKRSQATGSVQRYRARAKPWTDDEVEALKEGLRTWQSPRWTSIIKSVNGRLLDRTGVQCKDKARTEIGKLERSGVTNIDDLGDWKWAKAPFDLE